MKEIPLPFNSTEFQDAWQEWLKFRTESRFKKYVPTGLKRTFSKLITDSNNNVATAIAIIDQSISNNWQGLFPLKSNYNVPSSTNNTGRKLTRHEAGIASTLASLKTELNARGI